MTCSMTDTSGFAQMSRWEPCTSLTDFSRKRAIGICEVWYDGGDRQYDVGIMVGTVVW